SPGARAAALETLHDFAADARPVESDILPLLKDKNLSQRAMAARVIAAINAKRVPELLVVFSTVLDDGDPLACRRAISALRDIGPPAQQICKRLRVKIPFAMCGPRLAPHSASWIECGSEFAAPPDRTGTLLFVLTPKPWLHDPYAPLAF